MRLLRATRPLVVLLFPALAWGHVETGRAEGFVSGLHHPVSGLDHMLAMLAVGLWGAQLGAPALWLLPIAFPLVMSIGGAMGLAGIALPGIEWGIALSGILLGLAVAAEWQPDNWVAAVMVGFFAIFHGHAHGTELPAGASGLFYSMGFVMATGMLHATGIVIGLLHRWKWGKVLLRLCGLLIAAAGGIFLWRAAA